MASLHVYRMGDRVKVKGVAAVTDTAEMVKFQPVRDRANQDLVGKTVNVQMLRTDLPASVSSHQARPQPTRAEVWPVSGDGAVLVNLRP